MSKLDNIFERSLITAPAALSAGVPAVIQDLPVVPVDAIANGAVGTVAHKPMRCVRSFPKTAAEAWAFGQALYVIAATGIATTTVGTNKRLGYAASVQIAADTVGDVYLD